MSVGPTGVPVMPAGQDPLAQLVLNQKLMSKHQQELARQQQMETAKIKVVCPSILVQSN